MDANIERDTAQFAASVPRLNKEFSISEELAALMPWYGRPHAGKALPIHPKQKLGGLNDKWLGQAAPGLPPLITCI